MKRTTVYVWIRLAYQRNKWRNSQGTWGSIFGFKTMGVYIPSEDIYVLGWSNCDCNSPAQLTEDVAECALKMLQKK